MYFLIGTESYLYRLTWRSRLSTKVRNELDKGKGFGFKEPAETTPIASAGTGRRRGLSRLPVPFIVLNVIV
jgi:hypothetical protein